MAYVPGFKHDVFISYAVKDNAPPTDDSLGWVDKFKEQLRKDVEREVRERGSVEFWQDTDQIRCGDKFAKKIVDDISETALLVILLSKQYLVSKWCDQERSAFLKAIADQKNDERRVFVIQLTAPKSFERKNEELPDGLADIQHSKLWRDDHGVPKRIGDPIPDPMNHEHQGFFSEVVDIGQAIAQRLDEMRAAETKPEEKSAVYLAVATKGTAEEAFTKKLKTALENAIPVVPVIHLEKVPQENDAGPLKDALNRCLLYVQVVGHSPSPRNGLQQKLAATLPILFWKEEDIDVEDVDDANLKDLIPQARMGTLDEATREIIGRWNALRNPSEPKHPPIQEAKVFINYLPEDVELGGRVHDWLVDRRNRQCVKRPLDGASESELRAYFERKLLECRDMVLVYGKASRLSANDHAELCYQVLATQRNRSDIFANWYIVAGPPQQPGSRTELDVGLPRIRMMAIDGRTDLEAALEAAFSEGAQA